MIVFATPFRIVSVVALAGVIAAGGAFAAGAPKFDPKAKGPQGDTIDSIKLLPDWTGAWEPMNLPQGKAQYDVKLSLTPEWGKRFNEIKALAAAGKTVPSRTIDCHTRGMPGSMIDPMTLFEIFYTPGRVTIADAQAWTRRIYTDGRDHADIVDTFQGDSIGHWENNTLFVDTTSIDATNEFITGLNQGSDSHVTEKMFLKDPNTLEVDTVLDAPHALNAPYKYTTLYKRHRDWMVTQYNCVFDNLDTNRQIQR